MIDLNGHTVAELLQFIAGFAGLVILAKVCFWMTSEPHLNDLGE
tara:strand:- start:467 stop:598 length:132 start_codon:yes stop_codon:yes gene_type:complete